MLRGQQCSRFLPPSLLSVRPSVRALPQASSLWLLLCRSFIIEERSFTPCEDLLFGRMSFKGFNPEVEKLMIQMNSRFQEAEGTGEGDAAMEADVSDEEMARRYETLVGTIGKKFLKKRDRRAMQEPPGDEEGGSGDDNDDERPSQAKKAFLKPRD
uniref:M-phase phosphoprotein 6 n=1 Tax=Anolis carolinensis TaxID=28377 RepID=H9GHL9_ANOCA